MPNHEKSNRLIAEKSPYLLQHAHNPVDWYPWGEKAFEKAKQENKPVFVSIGYSTCHWCHVMAHESFEDEEVAALLNEHFVSIKVDREERPDIDSVYMTVCQALTGHGGWPLSTFLTPDQKPFYAGTYFPKESRFGQPGFMDILYTIANQFNKDRDKIVATGQQIVEALNQQKESRDAINSKAPDLCFEHMKNTFDPQYGGFGDAPKFPAPHHLLFLLRYGHLKGNEEAIQMVEKTLTGIADGGIHDHIGGGFARYSVDELWLIPHFEKMLYDQAMLMLAYTEAWQVTKNPRWERIVDRIFTYIIREMRDEQGGFYSAEDADSEGVEGKYYVWTPEEIFAVLDEKDAEMYCDVYDISRKGNFEGKSLPHLIDQQYDVDSLQVQLHVLNQKLLAERNKRIHPHKDDKVLTSWNGLMIAALATAARVFQKPAYLKAAEQAFNFIDENMIKDGIVFARYRDGEVKNEGFLDDYAFMMWACDSLYETTYDPRYVEKMKALAKNMKTHFWDESSAGFFLNNKNEALIIRPKDIYDGAIPSGNSVAAMMLLRLARRTGNIDHEMFVDKMFNNVGAEVNRYPMGHTWTLSAFLLAQMGTKELVVLLPDEHSEEKQSSSLQTAFLPEVILLNGSRQTLQSIASFTKDFHTIGNNVTYYLCEHFQCQRPTTKVEDIQNVLDTSFNE